MMQAYDTSPANLTEHTLEHEGCTIHYWMGGAVARPLVMMLHGATMDHRMFNAQVAALAADYRVLVWDAPGHGLSQPSNGVITIPGYAQAVLAIADAHGAEQFVVMGQSMGGYIAQHLYLSAPQRVQAMIVIGATPFTRPYSRLEVWTLKATLPLFDIWPYGHFKRMVARNTAVTPPVQTYALDAMEQIPQAEFLRIWKAVTLLVDTEGAPDTRFDVPLLLLHGDQDNTGSIKRDMPWWAQHDTHAQFHIIPQAGHNANQDNPEATNALIRDFLAQHL